MDDPCFGVIVILIACLGDPVTQVDIFAVHEELFIEQPDLVEDYFLQHHKSPGKNIHLMGLILVEVTKMIFAEDL